MMQGLNDPNSINKLCIARSTQTLETADDKEAPSSTNHLILSAMDCMPVINVDAGEVAMKNLSQVT